MFLLYLRGWGTPTCLLGKEAGDIDFCEDFKRGPAFGDCVEKDVGARRQKAEAIFARIRFEGCSNCRYWNTEGIYKWEIVDGVQCLFENREAAYCELKKTPSFRGYCTAFKRSWKRLSREDLKKQRVQISEYLQKLRAVGNAGTPVAADFSDKCGPSESMKLAS